MIAGFAFIADNYYFFEARKLLIGGQNLTDDGFPGCLSAPAGLSEYGVKT